MHRTLAEAIERFANALANCRQAEDRLVVERYLAQLAPILAEAVLGKDVLGRVQQMERLLGNMWLIDPQPFESALEKWRTFSSEYVHFVLRGMTVNERLHALSLTEAYDRAVATKNFEEIRGVLKSVHVDDDSIAGIVERIRRDA